MHELCKPCVFRWKVGMNLSGQRQCISSVYSHQDTCSELEQWFSIFSMKVMKVKLGDAESWFIGKVCGPPVAGQQQAKCTCNALLAQGEK